MATLSNLAHEASPLALPWMRSHDNACADLFLPVRNAKMADVLKVALSGVSYLMRGRLGDV